MKLIELKDYFVECCKVSHPLISNILEDDPVLSIIWGLPATTFPILHGISNPCSSNSLRIDFSFSGGEVKTNSNSSPA